MRLKRVFVLAAMLVATVATAAAQQLTMSIKGEPVEDPTDLDASAYFPETDENDNICALLKVTTTNPLNNELVLEVGGLGVTKRVEQPNGEIWFYLPAQVKNLHFSCYGYTKPAPVVAKFKPGKVYRLTIHTDATFQTVQNAVLNYGYLKMRVEPADAMIFLGKSTDYELVTQQAVGGFFSEQLNFDTYYYRIEHPLYKAIEGKVEFNKSTSELGIVLEPNYSYLTVESNPSGATVIIGGRIVGKTPCKLNERYPAGDLEVRLTKEDYHMFQTSVTVEGNGELQTVRFELQPRFANVTIICDDPAADILIDDVKKGVGTWSGTLSSTSSHRVESRRKGHHPQSISVSVKDGESVECRVPAPVPLYGAVAFESSPERATVEIDGKVVGTTPHLQQLLVGDYKVRISKEGHISQSFDIKVEHNQNQVITKTLQKGKVKVPVNIYCTDSNAAIYINGSLKGTGSWNGTLEEGTYELRTTRDNHKDGLREVTFDGAKLLAGAKQSENATTAPKQTISVPAPVLKVGGVKVECSDWADIYCQGPGESRYTLVGMSPYEQRNLPAGTYSFYASKSGYRNSETKTVVIEDGDFETITLKLRREPVWDKIVDFTGGIIYDIERWNDDYHGFDNTIFLEPIVGLPTNSQYMRMGANLGIFFDDDSGRTGIHSSFSLNGSNEDWAVNVGPLFRLNDSYDDVEWQTYLGLGVSRNEYCIENGQKWYLSGEAGVRVNFHELSEYQALSLSSVSLGAQYYGGNWFPTLGVSLWPGLLFTADQDNDICWVAEAMMSAGDGFQFGGSFAYMPSRLGWYTSLLFPDGDTTDSTTFTTGPVFSWLDGAFSAYAGVGTINDYFGVDFGLRLSYGYSMSLGMMLNGDMAFVTLGFGYGF